MPAQIIIDKEGRIRYIHYGRAMADIQENAEIPGLLDELVGRAQPEEAPA
jgi:peroxiredoxin Q/BCP